MSSSNAVSSKRRTVFVWSPQLMQVSSLLPSNLRRSAIVANLIRAYGLLTPSENFKLVKPSPAGDDILAMYHDKDYVKYITDPANSSDTTSSGKELDDNLGLSTDEGFGLTDDCPLFHHLPAYARLVAGASITAAESLRQNAADVAICWDGGRHHAQRAKASGYCYVQDVVLAILRLRWLPRDSTAPRPKIMYLDLDLHYSDAVSQAFANATSASILTLSIHHDAPGFYPASPHARLTSPETSDPYTLSIPIQKGASGASYAHIWPAVEEIVHSFGPTYVVVQCGVDGLAGDPCRVFNLELDVEVPGSIGWMVNRILDWDCKLLLLGGGGYNSPNVARAWTYITSIVSGNPLDLESSIPDHQFFPLYEPSFTLNVSPGHMRDENSSEYLNCILSTFYTIADRIRARSQT